MNLTNEQKQLAASFTKLHEPRKAEILAHLEATDGARRQATVGQIIKNGGTEAEFVEHIFGKQAPHQADAPENKKMGPPQTKSPLPHNRSQTSNQ